MKYSLEESLAADVAQKCLDFWYAFVEPFFGLPPRPKEAAIKVRLLMAPPGRHMDLPSYAGYARSAASCTGGCTCCTICIFCITPDVDPRDSHLQLLRLCMDHLACQQTCTPSLVGGGAGGQGGSHQPRGREEDDAPGRAVW